jgi:hypothetical protein
MLSRFPLNSDRFHPGRFQSDRFHSSGSNLAGYTKIMAGSGEQYYWRTCHHKIITFGHSILIILIEIVVESTHNSRFVNFPTGPNWSQLTSIIRFFFLKTSQDF